MIRSLIRLTLTLTWCACCTHAGANDSSQSTAHDSTPVVQKVEHAIEHGVKAGIHGVDHGLHAAAGGIEHGAHAAERGVARGAQASSHAIDTAAKKVGIGTKPAATQKP